jgi:MFS family permease
MLQLLKKYKTFTRYFLSDFFGKIADQYFIILLPFMSLFISNNPFDLSLILMCNAVGRIIMLPFGGVLVDRFRPQLFLLSNNLFQFLGCLILLFSWNYNLNNLYLLGFIALIFGLTDGISLPAGGSIVPRLVKQEDLLQANGLVSGVEQLTGIIGALAGGFAIAQLGISKAIFGSVILYLVSSIGYSTIINLKTENTKNLESKYKNWLQDFLEGWNEVKKNGVVSTVLIFNATSNIFVMGSVSIGLILLFKERFGVGADVYSLVGVFFGIGFILGLPLLNRLKKIEYPGRFTLCFAFLYMLAFFIFATASAIWIIMLTLVLIGVVALFDSTITSTWIQTYTDTKILGRVSSFLAFANVAVDPVGQALAGFLASYRVEYIFWVGGVGFMLIAILNYAFNPTMRKKFDLNFGEQK